jgi:hypothetical protein
VIELRNANQDAEVQKADLQEHVQLLAKKLEANNRRMSQIQADTAQQLEEAALCKEQCIKEAKQEIAALFELPCKILTKTLL